MDEPKTVSRATFDCVRFALMCFFAMAGSLAFFGLARLWGTQVPDGWMGGLAVFYLVLSHHVADRIFKRFGLSRSGTVVEVRSRSSFQEDDDPLGDVAEARMSSGMMRFTLIGTPLFGLLLLFASVYMGEELGAMRWPSLGMGVFFLVGFILMILSDRKTPKARVDAEGVTGYPSARAMRRRFVPWSDILTCEIQSIHNTFGDLILLRPILRGYDGETLMELNLMDTPIAEQERVVKLIKARLPKHQFDPWEL